MKNKNKLTVISVIILLLFFLTACPSPTPMAISSPTSPPEATASPESEDSGLTGQELLRYAMIQYYNLERAAIDAANGIDIDGLNVSGNDGIYVGFYYLTDTQADSHCTGSYSLTGEGDETAYSFSVFFTNDPHGLESISVLTIGIPGEASYAGSFTVNGEDHDYFDYVDFYNDYLIEMEGFNLILQALEAAEQGAAGTTYDNVSDPKVLGYSGFDFYDHYNDFPHSLAVNGTITKSMSGLYNGSLTIEDESATYESFFLNFVMIDGEVLDGTFSLNGKSYSAMEWMNDLLFFYYISSFNT